MENSVCVCVCTGSLPTGSLPTGSLPTGSLPTGSLPTGSLSRVSPRKCVSQGGAGGV